MANRTIGKSSPVVQTCNVFLVIVMFLVMVMLEAFPNIIGDPPMSRQKALDDEQAQVQCSDAAVLEFVDVVNANLWRSNALMVANAVLVATMVAVGASRRRYHHAAVARFMFMGSCTLYLPIVSYVASSIGQEFRTQCTSGLGMTCHGRAYVALLLIWTVLAQIVGTNTSAIIAVDDYDGGHQKLGPSIELLARTIWTSCLVFYYSSRGFLNAFNKDYVLERDDPRWYYNTVSQFLIVLCLLSLAKIMLKFYAFQKARRSFAHGRSTRLIAGYMERLQGDQSVPAASSGHEGLAMVPELIVMGEDHQETEETPYGYVIKQRNGSLVTVDMVWRMASEGGGGGDVFLVPRPWLRDLCLSFALFKLLRRRFARTHLAESGSAKAFNIVLEILLSNGNGSRPDSERVFRVIADEISFVLDSYYSSLPTSNFGRLLPILNITVSLSIMYWCLAGAALSYRFTVHHPYQIFCNQSPMSCRIPSRYLNDYNGKRMAFGNILFNVLPTFFLFVVVIIAEAWEVVSYLCSNWVKVTIVCNYVTHASWQQSPRVRRWLGLIVKLRIKFRRSWSDHMGQMSLLPAHQQQPAMQHGHGSLMSRRHFFFFLFSAPKKMQYVSVPSEVKVAIVDALKRSNRGLSKGTAALGKSNIGGHLQWACEGQGTSDVILAWHIATGLFETGRLGGAASSSTSTISSSSASARVVATRLSRYCIYLMAADPELLPDDRAWSRRLCERVSADIARALAGEPVEHDAMVARLSESSEHEVVKRGVKLGKQLLELAPGEEAAAWDLLAGFWSEILLYVAPSDNPKAHRKAIARGTELVTIVWALLTHAGIVARPGTRTAV